MVEAAPGAIPSPNIWNTPQIYEQENKAVDPDGVLAAAMRSIRPWDGQTVLDIGCGTGFHLPFFAETATRVIGAEPHAGLASAARRRCAGLPNVTVRTAAAQALPVPDSSVDVVHARWAYFFGPGCEPGLREIARVLRHGGTAFIIDNDATRTTFGRWFRTWLPKYDPASVERFWVRQGFSRESLTIRWSFPDRGTLERVLKIEFPADLAARFLAETDGTEVDYGINLWHRTFR
ncbi:class I SAM-dependent methyltransferase [Actinocorallia longicatena]|uniref:Class I SAM-dependent methyltransferase n=1 Tax=Actinocorallia longicatena TaxID=111803 RepID=A0ABP6QRB8_9ACTN